MSNTYRRGGEDLKKDKREYSGSWTDQIRAIRKKERRTRRQKEKEEIKHEVSDSNDRMD